MARSTGVFISDDLAQLIRARDLGPRLIQLYEANPALFEGKKYDLRFIVVFVRGIVYVYQMFWVRVANKPFSMSKLLFLLLADISIDDFNDYEKHFTVMNYAPSLKMQQVSDKVFIEEFENTGNSWKTTLAQIHSAIRGVIFTKLLITWGVRSV